MDATSPQSAKGESAAGKLVEDVSLDLQETLCGDGETGAFLFAVRYPPRVVKCFTMLSIKSLDIYQLAKE